MIQLIEAPPRSGKSYFFVNYLLKFCDYDKLYNEYILKPHVLLISNVRGLKVRHWSFPECLKCMSFEEFFTEENFHKIMEKTGKTHIILGIDECHEIFPASFTIKSHPWLYKFFAIHGHFGLDVFLMTQGLEATTRIFNPLVECIIKVKPRSQKLYKFFTYDYYSKSGKKLRSEQLKQRQLVFNAYRSFEKDEHNKPKSALLFWVTVSCLLMLIGVGLFVYTVNGIKNRGKVVEPVKQTEQIFEYKESERVSSVPGTDDQKPFLADPKLAADLDPDLVDNWRVYYLDGWAESGDDLFFIINGRSLVNSSFFRNFNPSSRTVEFYGPRIVARGLQSARNISGRNSGAGLLVRPAGEPLGEPSHHKQVVSIGG